jgi:putative membrane protein
MPTRPSRCTRTRPVIVLALALPLALCACSGKGDGAERDSATRTGALADTAALSATAGFVETSAAFTDAGILAMLDEANQSDSSTAALAIEKASDAEVKAFAAALMQDHHALRVKGEQLEKQLSLTPQLPAADPLAPALDDEMVALRAASEGPGFDRAYVEKEAITHQAIMDFAERARRSTPNPQIRAYIDQMTPVLRRHLARALALKNKLAPAA